MRLRNAANAKQRPVGTRLPRLAARDGVTSSELSQYPGVVIFLLPWKINFTADDDFREPPTNGPGGV